MTGPEHPEQPAAGSTTPPAWQRFLPAATFLVGLLLGSVLVAASQSRDGGTNAAEDGSASSPTSSPTPTSTLGDTVVTLPAACEESAKNLREATSLLSQSVDSVKKFDPDRLVEILNRLETLDNETRPLVDECSAVSVTSSPTSSPATGTPSATPTASPTS